MEVRESRVESRDAPMTIPAMAPPASRAARCTLPLRCAAAELARESATAATSLSLSERTDMMISKLTMWGGERRYTKLLVACLRQTLKYILMSVRTSGGPTQETPSLEPSPAKAGSKPATGTRSGSTEAGAGRMRTADVMGNGAVTPASQPRAAEKARVGVGCRVAQLRGPCRIRPWSVRT